jgi:transposase
MLPNRARNKSSHIGLTLAATFLTTDTAVCFLPTYSLDLDPIEQVFVKLKNTLRKMARRTVDALWNAIEIAPPRGLKSIRTETSSVS